MHRNQENRQRYDSIRQSVMNDVSLKDNPARLVAFMENYKDHIKNEPSVFEWEANLWERGLRGGFFMITCMVLIATVYMASNELHSGLIMGAVLIGVIVFFAAMLCYPERYYHRITKTGVYVYSYQRGKVYREKLSKGLLILGSIAAVILLFTLGPMAFAGAGAGALGLFKFAAMVKDKPPKEFALPWEAIFAIEVNDFNGFLHKEKMFFVQYQMRLICDKDNFSEVRRTLEDYKKNQTIFIKPGRKYRQMEPFKTIREDSKKEIDFVWAFHPRNRPGA